MFRWSKGRRASDPVTREILGRRGMPLGGSQAGNCRSLSSDRSGLCSQRSSFDCVGPLQDQALVAAKSPVRPRDMTSPPGRDVVEFAARVTATITKRVNGSCRLRSSHHMAFA
jgi:hypothetical protein